MRRRGEDGDIDRLRKIRRRKIRVTNLSIYPVYSIRVVINKKIYLRHSP